MDEEYDAMDSQLKLTITIHELLQVEGNYMNEFTAQLKSYEELITASDMIIDKIQEAINKYKTDKKRGNSEI